ncbi:hypothetical protein CCMA1212_007867 [Trichoderma ghanense]|uniref:Uncharacterized protein n=1 Tax=Trichoderma ghanense TaxID=65468 RepID=A0ABY2GWW6_9HYPO
MQRSTASPARAPALSRIHASRQHPIETQQLIDRFLLQKRSHGFICRNSASHCDAHRAKDSKAQGFRTCGHSREKLPALRDSNSFSPASEGPAGPGSYYASAVGPGTGCPGSGTWIALARGTRAGLRKYTQLCFSLLSLHVLSLSSLFSEHLRKFGAGFQPMCSSLPLIDTGQKQTRLALISSSWV